MYIWIFARDVVCIKCVLLKKAKTCCHIRGIHSDIQQVIKPMDYNYNILHNFPLKMFLTILEDGSKITRFWGKLTSRTHHVKLPWEKQSSLKSTPVIFRVFYWDLLMFIVNQTFRGNWSFWIQKYIVDYQRNTLYKHRSSPSKIYGLNDYFYLKLKNTRSC